MITISGIAQGSSKDDRTRVLLNVEYQGETFHWEIRVPPSYTGSFQDFVNQMEDNIYADIADKLQQWEELDPKERQIDTGMEDEAIITVPINRDEIVKPTYPDYYALRASAYPDIREQLAAVWKGGSSRAAMINKIASVKALYPKPPGAFEDDSAEALTLGIQLTSDVLTKFNAFASAYQDTAQAASLAGADVPSELSYESIIYALQQLSGEEWVKRAIELQSLWNALLVVAERDLQATPATFFYIWLPYLTNLSSG